MTTETNFTPGPWGWRTEVCERGLTKREYFAAMAMQGLCCREGYGSMEDVAHDALAVADARLAELDKEAT